MNAPLSLLHDDLDDTWPEGEIWKPEGDVDEPIETIKERVQALPQIPEVLPSRFTEFVFRMPNLSGADGYSNFSFEGRRHMRRIYDTPAKRVLLCCGRQVEKSTCIGNRFLTYMTLVPGIRILYVSPSTTQTKTFSNDRIKEPIETSPILRKFTTNMLMKNIFEKQFVNRSMITLRYAYLNADRTRGVPAHVLGIDEIQDVLSTNIPVIEHCQSHASDEHRNQLYSGTPKSLDNVIEDYRSSKSTQGEWVVPCTGCNNWNILGEKNIGRKGPICAKCGKTIDPQGERSQWAWMVQPDPKDPNKVPWESYRIPQLMVPWKIKNWHEVIYDYENHQRPQFMNECLGISYESGLRPITKAQMRAVCGTRRMADLDTYRPLSLSQPFFLGIDWGTGDLGYTVMVLSTYIDGKFCVLYAKRFVGEEADPDVQVKLIIEFARNFNVFLLGADWGFGYSQNNALQRTFGAEKVHKYQYCGKLARKMLFDRGIGHWKLHRTEVMSSVFSAIKKGLCEFPCWDDFKDPFAKDFTNIFSEFSETLRMIKYDHKPHNPDDTFHAFALSWLVSMLVYPRPDIISPSKEDEHGSPLYYYDGPVDQG